MSSMTKESRMRRWSNVELMLFVTILANEDDSFVFSLESRAIKRKANEEVFESIRKNFDKQLALNEVVNKIKKEIGDKKFSIEPKIDTSVIKLRTKYKALKCLWKKFNQMKTGSGACNDEEPEWFKVLDPALTATYAILEDGAETIDIQSFTDRNKSTDNEDESAIDNSSWHVVFSPCSPGSENHNTVANGDDKSEGNNSACQSTDSGPINKETSCKLTSDGRSQETVVTTCKTVNKTEKETNSSTKENSRKRKVEETSQEQVLHDLSEGIQKMNDRMEVMISEGKARDEAFLKFYERQSELNRQHELRMMEMMMRFVQPQQMHHTACNTCMCAPPRGTQTPSRPCGRTSAQGSCTERGLGTSADNIPSD